MEEHIKKIERLFNEYREMFPELTLKEVTKQLKKDVDLYGRFSFGKPKKIDQK